nr:MAG TPA: hypothetical protein [Caudoviricetes sp.]
MKTIVYPTVIVAPCGSSTAYCAKMLVPRSEADTVPPPVPAESFRSAMPTFAGSNVRPVKDSNSSLVQMTAHVLLLPKVILFCPTMWRDTEC